MFTRCVPRPLLLALMVTVAACTGEHGPALSDKALPSLEPIVSFGCAECEGPEMLSNPQVVLAPSGRIYLLETDEPLVRVLGADGELVFATGQLGQGPGEIRAPLLVAAIEQEDGSFWIVGASHMHLYSASGEPLESRSYRARVPIGVSIDHRRPALYQVAFTPIPGDPAPRALLRFAPGVEEPEEMGDWEELVGESAEEASAAHARWSTIAVGPDDSIAIVDARNYRIRLLEPDGSLRVAFGRPDLEPILKEPERLERERQQAAARGLNEPDPYLPQTGNRAAIDARGRLWLPVRRGPGLVDVFGPDGTFLGEVDLGMELMSGYASFSMVGDRLGTAVYDDQGLAQVRVWRIVGP